DYSGPSSSPCSPRRSSSWWSPAPSTPCRASDRSTSSPAAARNIRPPPWSTRSTSKPSLTATPTSDTPPPKRWCCCSSSSSSPRSNSVSWRGRFCTDDRLVTHHHENQQTTQRKKGGSTIGGRIGTFLVLALFLVLFGFPVYFGFIGSVMGPGDINSYPASLWPWDGFAWENYADAL